MRAQLRLVWLLAWGGVALAAPLVLDVRACGALGDGRADDTAAIQRALDAAAGQGATVLVPAGVYRVRPLVLRSHERLTLAAGARLQGSGEVADWLCEGKLAPLLGGRDLNDVTIEGAGTIDGAGPAWWARHRAAVAAGQPEPPRPRLVQLGPVRRLRVSGLTLSNSPMFHLVPVDGEDVELDHLTIASPADSPNTDAIDPVRCRRLSIHDCTLDVGDDNIALKDGGWDVRVEDCAFRHGHGLSIGSETTRGIHGLRARRCTFDGTKWGLRIKSNRERGGLVEDCVYEDITLRGVGEPLLVSAWYPRPPPAEDTQPLTATTPRFRRLTFRDIRAEGAARAGELLGLPESPVADVVCERVRLAAERGLSVRWATGVELRDTTITARRGEAVTWAHASPAVVVRAGESVQAALDRVPRDNAEWLTIALRPGLYREKLNLDRRPFVRLVGESAASTVLSWDDSARRLGANGQPLGTGGSPSVTVRGHDFDAERLTIENCAGPGKLVDQAVALDVRADRATFVDCVLRAHQDTLYAASGRQLYRGCRIAGDCDFVFGNAAAVFSDCELHSVGYGFVTAQSRTRPDEPTGYVFDRCRLTAEPGMPGCYLGRPWRPYARVVWLDCELGAHIRGAGWHNWGDPTREATAWFGEWGSHGPGARPLEREPWSRQLTAAEVAELEPARFLAGADDWRPLW